MSNRSTHHDTFVIEREYDAAPEKVFRAFAEPAAKERWFVEPGERARSDHKLDFRVGGMESVSGGPAGGPVFSFSARFQDIVPNERIVSTYEMHMDDKRISVSLATTELFAAGKGTRLVYTEQAVFLDGYDNAESREKGTRGLLDKLGESLAERSGR